MDRAIVKQLESFLPQILNFSKRNRSLWFDYDKEADTLYVSFVKPQQATDTEFFNDDILIRKRGEEIVGVTVMHASSFR